MPGESPASRVILLKPPSGSSALESMQPGSVYVLDFSEQEPAFERQGDDMRLIFEDASLLTLRDFWKASREQDITLELRDGTQLSGVAVMEALTLPLGDFHTDQAVVPPSGAAHVCPVNHSSEKALLLEDLLDSADSGESGLLPVCAALSDTPLRHGELPGPGAGLAEAPAPGDLLAQGAHGQEEDLDPLLFFLRFFP